MKKVLIVSPCFPPLNTADMQRVRLSLSFYKDNGWQPIVLTIDSQYINGVKDDLLLKTIPKDIKIHKVKAISFNKTSFFGLNNPGIRSIPYLYKKGLEIIRNEDISLVFFSTTSFHVLLLGRLWKRKTNVPYVIDMQDPWYSKIDYSENFNNSLKYRIDRKIHKCLESWTMKRADGIVSVSQTYIDTLKKRYRTLEFKPTRTITFGTSNTDFEVLKNNPQKNNFFSKNSDQIIGVYVGRGGKDMETSLSIIFKALQIGIKESPSVFKKIKLYFIGTNYAPGKLAKKTVEPVADKYKVSEYVEEYPERIPYFETLQILKESDFLIVPGSEDPQYSASKIYPYIMSEKPMISVFHKDSPVIKIISELNCGEYIQFALNSNLNSYSKELYLKFKKVLERIPFVASTDWSMFKKFTSEELTKRQCQLFNEVLTNNMKKYH